MSFCMSFCLVGYEFFCHQAVYTGQRERLQGAAREGPAAEAGLGCGAVQYMGGRRRVKRGS